MSEEDLKNLTGLFDDSVKDIVQTLVTSGYSRDAELAADQKGREFLAGAGYDPQALAGVLGCMQDHGGAGGMFSTHPAPRERIDALGAPVAFGGSADGVAARARRFSAAFGR
jgi:predicted Zn-dependent protease